MTKRENRIELSRRSVIDRVKPDDIIQVQDATTGSWVTYRVWHDRLPEPYFRTGIKEKK